MFSHKDWNCKKPIWSWFCLGVLPEKCRSTGHVVAAGWEVKLSKDEISLRRLKGNLVGYGSSWSGCPWIYLEGHDQPKKKVTFGRTQVKMDVDEECSSSPMEVGNVSAMTVLDECFWVDYCRISRVASN